MKLVSFGQSLSLLSLCLAAALFLSDKALAQQTEPQTGSGTVPAATAEAAKTQAAKTEAAKETASGDQAVSWKPMKDAWVASQFGGDGPVEIADQVIQLGIGDPLTGVRWQGDLVRENFEIELEARRTDGFDFFCGLTFPVGKDHVSLILGGWGGGVVGISSIDGSDASENATSSFRNFDNEQWYKVRVRVDPYEIRAWIDDKLACDHPREGHTFDIRYEMDQSVPLGIAAFQCKSELRGIRYRKLTDQEVAEAKKKIEESK